MQIKIPWDVITYPLEMADFLEQLKIPSVGEDTEKNSQKMSVEGWVGKKSFLKLSWAIS